MSSTPSPLRSSACRCTKVALAPDDVYRCPQCDEIFFDAEAMAALNHLLNAGYSERTVKKAFRSLHMSAGNQP